MPNNYQHGFDVIDPRTGKVVFSQGTTTPQQPVQTGLTMPSISTGLGGKPYNAQQGNNRGVVGDIVAGLPFARGILANMEAGNISDFYKNQINNGTYRGGSIITANKDGYKPKYLTSQELQNSLDHPILENFVKPMVNASSFLVPGSAGWKGAGAAGLLMGIGNSDKTNAAGILGDAVTGGISGIAGYGGIKAFGKVGGMVGKKIGLLGDKAAQEGAQMIANDVSNGAGSAIKGTSAKALAKVYGIKAGKDLSAVEAEKLALGVDTLAKARGMALNTPEQRSFAVDALKNEVGQQFSTEGSKIPLDNNTIDTIISKFESTLGDNPKFIDNPDVHEIVNKLNKLKDSGATFADLKNVESFANSYLNDAKQSVMGGGIPDGKRVYDAASDAIHEGIVNHPELQKAGISDIYKNYAQLSKIRKFTDSAYNKAAPSLKAPFLRGVDVPLPGANTAQYKAAQFASRNLSGSPLTQTVDKGVQDAVQQFVPQELQQEVLNQINLNPGMALPIIQKFVGSSPFGAYSGNLARGLLSNGGGQQLQDQGLLLGVDPAQYGYPEDPTVQYPNGQSAYQGGGLMSMGGNTQQDPAQQRYDSAIQQRQSAFLSLTQSGVKPAEAINTIDFLIPLPKEPTSTGGKMLSAGALDNKIAIEDSLSALNDLQSSFNDSRGAFNPLTGKLRTLNPFDTQAKGAKATVALVRQIVGKGLEGGVLRKEDEVKYRDILPNESDTPEVVQNKINKLKSRLESKYKNFIMSYQQGGYDPFAGVDSQATSSSPFTQY